MNAYSNQVNNSQNTGNTFQLKNGKTDCGIAIEQTAAHSQKGETSGLCDNMDEMHSPIAQ